MSLRKDMTINERVLRQNINNEPSVVIPHLSLIYKFINHFISMDMWIISEITGSF